MVDVVLATTKRLEAPALWAVPIGYAALIIACEYFFVKHAFPRLHAPAAAAAAAAATTASGLQFVTMYIAMALPLGTFAAAIFVDAGKLTKANVGAALACYRFDGIIFPEGRPDGDVGQSLHVPQIVVQVTEAGTFNRRLTSTEVTAVRTQGLRLVPVHDVADIDNIYDQGFLANLRHRLFAAPV
ncbi:hypothetical protein D0Z00_003810 [Geotrichum galactomycetum]|uniref:Uncharacterized protein n=1 Tax=Geotrichum galactomycetum TaxID=27317 RepID=A0ACB6V097_9ASCO|nr:hypothetical protein D0Z00_003810 [Geotrichum candidum]